MNITATQIAMMNHMRLLQKYIHHIIDCEGIDFLQVLPNGELSHAGRVKFTKEEIAELQRLSYEPLGEWGDSRINSKEHIDAQQRENRLYSGAATGAKWGEEIAITAPSQSHKPVSPSDS